VPLLGAFSWALSALLGNANWVRLSTRLGDALSPLIDVLADVSEAGREMASRTRVMLFDRDDAEAHRAMSEAADVRIAFGGREAVEAVRAYPCRWDCEDILFGPRASMAVVDPALMDRSACKRLATDVAYFDQMACSSPQVVFVKGAAGQTGFDQFIERMKSAMETASTGISRHSLGPSETYQIQLDRARVVLSGGDVHCGQATRWTLAAVERPRGDVVCINRFVQLVPFDDFARIAEWIPRNIQTSVTALGDEDFETFTRLASQCGVCRFPAPGEGNHFETPWDGAPLVCRLVRWVTRTDPPKREAVSR
jgi:hypothetical protein